MAVCSAVVNNGLDSLLFLKSYIGTLWPTKYWKNRRACPQHKPQSGSHKTVYTIWQVFNNCDFWEWQELFDSIQNFK